MKVDKPVPERLRKECPNRYWQDAHKTYGYNIPGYAQGAVFPGDEAGHRCELSGQECFEGILLDDECPRTDWVLEEEEMGWSRGYPMDSNEKFLYGRDIAARIEELEKERENLESDAEDALEEFTVGEGNGYPTGEMEELHQAKETAYEELASWEADNLDELNKLKELYNEIPLDATLIHEDHFEDYCRDMVRDIHGEIPDYIVVDWEATADNIRVDYTQVEFDDATYLYRD